VLAQCRVRLPESDTSPLSGEEVLVEVPMLRVVTRVKPGEELTYDYMPSSRTYRSEEDHERAGEAGQLCNYASCAGQNARRVLFDDDDD
jgi:hypothetical protein